MAKEGLHSWEKLPLGCSVPEAGSAAAYNTGDWRSGRFPFTQRESCIKCGLCYIMCPDICYHPDPQAEGYYTWDSFYCKGCGICIHECPKKAIVWKDEKEEEEYGSACGD
ncbi:MAG: 4Fe-4S binding protein [Desulfarculales bacterium]|jgi:pyruvate ferredoxin oxidoreductase delta subunit|nr:4Fe-4S binding protein [Desulfarculales bacterium]